MVKSPNSTRRNAGPNAYYAASELGSRTYDQIYAQRISAMVEFYVSCAKKYGDPVLELGVGTGLVAWAIAAAGLNIIGTDLSQPMLDIARSKEDSESPVTRNRIEFQQADMVDFQLNQQFSTIIIPGRAFQHLTTPHEQRSALICIRNHLRAGGTLVLNLFDPRLEYCLPDSVPPSGVEEFTDSKSGQRIRRTFVSRTTDPLSQTFSEQVRLEVFDEAGVKLADEETSWSLRWTYQQEMRYLFELTGFQIEEQFSDFLGSRPDYGKEQVWIVHPI